MKIQQIRRVRNYLVHGIEIPDAEFIQQMGATLEGIKNEVLEDPRPDVRRAAQRVSGREL